VGEIEKLKGAAKPEGEARAGIKLLSLDIDYRLWTFSHYEIPEFILYKAPTSFSCIVIKDNDFVSPSDAIFQKIFYEELYFWQ